MIYNIDQIRKKFINLPEDVQEAYTAVETTNSIIKIKEKYRLHVDQSSILAEEVGYVILGFTKPVDFIPNIISKLHITQAVATGITKDINEKIFNPIKESLKKIHSLESTDNEPLVKTKPTDSDTIFDSKLKGLFTNNTSTNNKNSDPYHEGI